MTHLSIILPVYNVEKYIRPCMESIFRQGLDEECFEVILINDGTKDNGLIVNTVSQVASTPNMVAVCIQKQPLTL